MRCLAWPDQVVKEGQGGPRAFQPQAFSGYRNLFVEDEASKTANFTVARPPVTTVMYRGEPSGSVSDEALIAVPNRAAAATLFGSSENIDENGSSSDREMSHTRLRSSIPLDVIFISE